MLKTHSSALVPLVAILATLTTSMVPGAQRLGAGFDVTLIDPPPGMSFASPLEQDPASAEGFLCALGDFGNQGVYHLNISDLASPTFQLIANGDADLVGGDDVLDNQFGSIGGITVLPTGELIVVSNSVNFNDFTGQTIFIGRDLNFDGDYLDVVAGSPEVTELLGGPPPDPGPFGFGGGQARVAPPGSPYAGDLFVITADGNASGELFRIQDPAGTPTLSFFKTGLNLGAGIDFQGDDVLIGEVNFIGFTFDYARVLRLSDGSADGDADDAGETVVIDDTLDGIFDLALGNDGRLHVIGNKSDFTGMDVFSIPDAGFETPRGEFGFDDGASSGDIVAESGTAAPLDPHSGPNGQRLYAIETPPFGFTGGHFVILEPAPPAAIASLDPLILADSLSPANINSGEYGSALTFSPATPELLFAVLGAFGNQDIWQIDTTDPALPQYTRVANGAADLFGADDVLDSGFGNVAGLAMFPTGELIIVENEAPLSGPPDGDTIFIARDLNGDGDFLDVVGATPEVEPLLVSIPGVGGSFTGMQAEIGPDGAVYVITADGGNGGEVIRIEDPLGTPVANIFFEDATNGIDFGSGLAWIGNDLYVGDVDDTFTTARLRRLRDTTADGDALDSGESEILTSSLTGAWDLASGPGGTLWHAQFGALNELDPSSGATLRTIAVPALTPGFNTLGDITFSPNGGSFEPGAPLRATLATMTNDFGGVSFVHLLTPSPSATTPVVGFDLYR
jgi:hypothetical protein